MENLISIIIRTKNEERWIGSCLRKIVEQRKVKSEVIIVDNLSKDKTLEICKRFKTKIVKIKNFLPGKAINMGIKKSKGSVIVFPSFIYHRVTPVTKGTRYSLVTWNLGYPYV